MEKVGLRVVCNLWEIPGKAPCSVTSPFWCKKSLDPENDVSQWPLWGQGMNRGCYFTSRRNKEGAELRAIKTKGVVARACIPSTQEAEAKARRSQKLENRVRYMQTLGPVWVIPRDLASTKNEACVWIICLIFMTLWFRSPAMKKKEHGDGHRVQEFTVSISLFLRRQHGKTDC